MAGQLWPTRRVAETSVPAFEEIHNANPLPTPDNKDLTWAEDSITRWRALTVFGGLVVLAGAFASWGGSALTSDDSSLSLIALGVMMLLVGGLLAGTLANEYTWALFGAAAMSVLFGALWSALGADWAPRVLLFEGLFIMCLGVSLAIVAQALLPESPD